MEEFLQKIEELKTLTANSKNIASGTGVDNIDVSKFITEATALAESAFLTGAMNQCQMVARRDAYDYVTAVSRVAKTVLKDRKHYYENAAIEYDRLNVRNEFTKAAIITLEGVTGGH